MSGRPLNAFTLSRGGELAAVLRASGPEFDVGRFVVPCDWRIDKVFHRVEARRPSTRPEGRKNEESGLNVLVSDADINQFAEQLRDAVEFLTHSAAEVRRLVTFPGVAGVVLD